MRKSHYLLLLWSSLVLLVAGFTSEDHEIFRLKDELGASEGQDVTFYDFIGVSPSATQEQITKASRKKSRQLHPDKVKQSLIAARATATRKPKLGRTHSKKPGVTVNKAPTESEIQRAVVIAQQKYQILSVVTEVLKGSGRERYDYFLSHGFPKWRGTGYYYKRFRPGLGSVLFGLFIVGGGAVHYGAMYVGWKRQREFVGRYIRHARRSAWGDESGIRGIPGLDGNVLGSSAAASTPSFAQENGNAVLNRRQKRLQDKEAKKEAKKGKSTGSDGTNTPVEAEITAAPQGVRKKVQAENGKILIVDSLGRVYLEEEDENGEKGEFLLDPDEIPRPTIQDTVLYRLPIWTYDRIRTRIFGEKETGQRLGTTPDTDVVETENEDILEKAALNGHGKKRNKRKGGAEAS